MSCTAVMDKNIAREEGKNIERKTQREKKRKLSPLAKSAVLSRAKSSRVCYHSASKQHENVNIALPPPRLSHRSTCTTLLYSLLRSLLTYFLSSVCVDTLNPPSSTFFLSQSHSCTCHHSACPFSCTVAIPSRASGM